MANHLSIKPSYSAGVSRTLTVATEVAQTVLLQAGVNAHGSPTEALEAPRTVFRSLPPAVPQQPGVEVLRRETLNLLRQFLGDYGALLFVKAMFRQYQVLVSAHGFNFVDFFVAA